MEFVQLFDWERIETRVRELGREISAHYGDEPLVCVCVLKGAYVFFADLMRALSIHPVVDFVRLSSYADQTSRSRIFAYCFVSFHRSHNLGNRCGERRKNFDIGAARAHRSCTP